MFLTLLSGLFIGLVNGLIVTKGKINSFIATLGTMAIIRGTTYVFTKASAVINNIKGFDYLGTGSIFGMPVTVLIFIVMAVLTFYILKYTVLGRNIYAVGGNVNAARLSGINTDKIKIISFMIAGLLGALTSIISASRMDSGQPNAGTNFEFLVITAVILGGVSMTGGRGNVFGVILGVLILKVLNNGLVLLNISSFYQDIMRGIVIVLAVFIDEKRRRDIGKSLLQNQKILEAKLEKNTRN
jgi:ribose transport system permease protein